MYRGARAPFLLGSALALVAATAPRLDAQTASRRRVFPVPIVGHAPETSLMLGVALVGVVSAESGGPATRPSTALLTAIYTLKHQYQLELALDHWTPGDVWHLTGDGIVERFPSQFNGIGAQATDTSEIYTPQRYTILAGAQRRVARHLYAGASYGFRHTRMVGIEAGGRLETGTIPGSRGGDEAIVTAEGIWDSRDALYRTRSGAYARLAFGVAGAALGGDHAFRRYTADARWYTALGAETVLAAQLTVDATDGTVPFDLLPHLGGSGIVRGFAQPRYTDGAMGAAQLELRAPLRGIVSFTAFGGAGTTAPSVADLPRATMRVAVGAGLRFLLDRRDGLQLRLDYAFAPGGGGLYIGAGDAF